MSTSALSLIAAVASNLASSEALDDVVQRTLELVKAALPLSDCALFLVTPEGLSRGWGIGGGSAVPSTESLRGPATDALTGLLTWPLVTGQRRLGVLAVQCRAALDADQRLILSVVSDLLAPALANAEHAHQMAVEVRLRTQQIEEQRRFTEKIIDSLPVGLYVIDREYRIHAWNRKRETGIQGVSREEAIGRTIFEILHRQPAELLRREFDDVFTSGKISTFHMESTATGDLRTFRISKIPMRVDDANVTHVITIGEDMTDWRQAQERVAQAEKLAAIGQLAAGVMHEINNPLATIGACAESMGLKIGDQPLPSPLGESFADYLKIIDHEVHRCKRIIDGLLDFSRPKLVSKSAIDVNLVLEETLFLLKHHDRFKRMTVERELDGSLGSRVHGSAEQMIQVFMALLLNAMDAMGGRGTVVVHTRRGRGADDGVIVEVRDQGHGIPRGEMPKIFEPFYTSKPPGRGTGLGLSICYAIVADHGGRIEVDSVVGKGSTFRVILPEAVAA